MAAIINYYNYLFHELADKRTKDFFLADSPLLIMGTVALYYYFVTEYGPRFMKNRPAFNIDRLLIVYNIFQIIVNGYIFITATYNIHRVSIICEPVDYSDDYLSRLQLNCGYIYFMVKITDLLDTVFFVLRKKQNQVSFLHLYHHILMVVATWLGFRYVSGGQSVYFGLLNTGVHTVMYFYYLLTVYNSKYKKSIWWKKHITQLQLAQFVAIIAIYTPLVFRKDCSYPKFFAAMLTTQAVVMLYLFSKFYYSAYIKPQKAPTNGVHHKRS